MCFWLFLFVQALNFDSELELTIKKRLIELANNIEEYQVLRDIANAVLHDSWMNIVIWGQPRTGKTTLQMRLAYAVLQDWDLVLDSFVYNLIELLAHMERGIPCRVTSLNNLHSRVPFIMPDDLGAHGNKAKTQHERAWDILKGSIDTYGTQIAIWLSSMGNPDSLTEQLQSKYTHEIYVDRRGHAKYDVIEWQQNFSGWQPRRKKAWLQEFDFENVPMDVYKQYDEKRLQLVQDLNQLIKDAMVDDEAFKLLRRLERKDFELLGKLKDAPVLRVHITDEGFGEVAKRCKARGLVIPTRKPGITSYYYDITDLGLEVHKLHEKSIGKV